MIGSDPASRSRSATPIGRDADRRHEQRWIGEHAVRLTGPRGRPGLRPVPVVGGDRPGGSGGTQSDPQQHPRDRAHRAMDGNGDQDRNRGECGDGDGEPFAVRLGSTIRYAATRPAPARVRARGAMSERFIAKSSAFGQREVEGAARRLVVWEHRIPGVCDCPVTRRPPRGRHDTRPAPRQGGHARRVSGPRRTGMFQCPPNDRRNHASEIQA